MSNSVRLHRWQPTRLPCPWDSPGKNTGVGYHFLLQCRKVKRESEVAQSCLTLHDPMDCCLPGSSVHGIFQARVLEWVAIAFSEPLLTTLIQQLWDQVQKATVQQVSQGILTWVIWSSIHKFKTMTLRGQKKRLQLDNYYNLEASGMISDGLCL